MPASRRKRLIPGLLALAVAAGLAGGYVAWKPVADGGLCARLIVENPVLDIETPGFFRISLEVKNVGWRPLSVSQPATIWGGGSFEVYVLVTDEDGRKVKATSHRPAPSPPLQWVRLVPYGTRRWEISRPASRESMTAPAKPGGILDTGTEVWHLSPGKYRVSAWYSSFLSCKSLPTPHVPVDLWSGMVAAAPVEIEVKAKVEK
jgi:hypothetical protein